LGDVEMVWAIIGGIVIISLPVFETVVSFRKAKAEKDARDAKGMEYAADGLQLKIGGASESEADKVGISSDI